jgi:hypothetical protein
MHDNFKVRALLTERTARLSQCLSLSPNVWGSAPSWLLFSSSVSKAVNSPRADAASMQNTRDLVFTRMQGEVTWVINQN